MEWGSISAIVGATVVLAGAVGGLLVRAYITPLKNKLEATIKASEEKDKDHEGRLRHLESTTSEHNIHLENLMKAVDKLVDKIDILVTYETRKHNGGE